MCLPVVLFFTTNRSYLYVTKVALDSRRTSFASSVFFGNGKNVCQLLHRGRLFSDLTGDLVTACFPVRPSSPQMVFDAIKTLKERNGSSIQAIKKSITATYPTLNFTPHQMRSALKKGVESGKFIKVRNAPSSTSVNSK